MGEEGLVSPEVRGQAVVNPPGGRAVSGWAGDQGLFFPICRPDLRTLCSLQVAPAEVCEAVNFKP